MMKKYSLHKKEEAGKMGGNPAGSYEKKYYH